MTNLDGNSFMTGSHHHQRAAAEEKYACTRYCTWVHLFGNAYQCHTHNQLHVCDQNCRQLVPATATSVCRLSKVGSCISHGRSHALTLSLALRSFVRSFVRSFLKKVFTTTNAGMDVDAVKRKATARGGAVYDEHQHNNNIKRTNSGVR